MQTLTGEDELSSMEKTIATQDNHENEALR